MDREKNIISNPKGIREIGEYNSSQYFFIKSKKSWFGYKLQWPRFSNIVQRIVDCKRFISTDYNRKKTLELSAKKDVVGGKEPDANKHDEKQAKFTNIDKTNKIGHTNLEDVENNNFDAGRDLENNNNSNPITTKQKNHCDDYYAFMCDKIKNMDEHADKFIEYDSEYHKFKIIEKGYELANEAYEETIKIDKYDFTAMSALKKIRL